MEAQSTRQRPPRPPPINSSRSSHSIATSDDVTDDTHSFRRLYDETFGNVDQALQLDEMGQVDEAYNLYRKSITMIDQALLYTLPTNVNVPSEQIYSMHEKLRRTKIQIKSRCEVLRSTSGQSATSLIATDTLSDEDISPPSYEQATSSLSIGDEILDADIIPSSSSSMPVNAQEIFCIAEGVQIYFITAEGYVSAPSYPSSLRVYRFTDDVAGETNAPEFLQIGQWYYPLVPGLSPVLHSDDNSYIFPDTTSPDSGCSVGLIVPNTISQAQRDQFEHILRSVTVMQSQPPTQAALDVGPVMSSEVPQEVTDDQSVEGARAAEPIEIESSEENDSENRLSLKISRGIITVASYVSRGVAFGAEKAGQYIKLGSNKIQASIRPEETTKEIPEKYQNGLAKVRKATNVAVSVSGFVVKLLGDATVKLGQKLAPHVIKHGEKIIPESMLKKSNSGHSKLDELAEVAGSSLAGFGVMYTSLELAAKAMARSIATETVDVVNYKYGAQAGKLAENSLYSAGNILMTGHNAQHLGVKAIARRAAKDAGKAVIDDMYDKKPQKPLTLSSTENAKGGTNFDDQADANGSVSKLP